MKKYTLTVFFSFLLITIVGQDKSLHEVLNVLDQTLENQGQYTLLKEGRINAIKERKTSNKTPEEIYYLNNELIEEYITYSCNAAIQYIEENISIANRMNNKLCLMESDIMLAKAYAYAGLFSESYEILESIDPKELSDELKIKYYSAYYRFYDSLIKYTNDNKYSDKYRQEMLANLDSALSLIPVKLREANIEMMYKYFLEGKYELIINELSKRILSIDPNSHQYAIVSSFLAYVYKVKGENPELQKLYLVQAAITDARLAIKDHSALLNLAILLHSNSDSDRSYRYIRRALDDANFYNSRHRSSVIIKALPIIERTYLNRIEKQRKNISLTLTLVSFLAVGLLLTSIYIYRQVRIVTKARRSLKQLNKRLDEANHIKEEYIGYFLNQCSVYINKLDEYKQLIFRKIKSGQVDDLLKSLSSPGNKKRDIEELYANFDAAFLKLYPSFIDDFNSLLKENERYKVKSNELNSELRIFALIRLGITDNKQISSFLRYSVQTIYNYRSKVKTRALNEGEDLEEKMKNLGVL